MNREFRKRHYHSIGELFKDMAFIVGKIPLIIRNRLKGWIDSDFQERLMMAVTAVNGCRYCNYYHTRVALRMDFEPEMVESLLAGDIDCHDPYEVNALLYAQHWAENNAKPDADLRDQLYATYGHERAVVIELILRMIRFGNLSGNSLDYFLFIISGGRWGQ
jgi:AhpD family alkylhydroperoxidase